MRSTFRIAASALCAVFLGPALVSSAFATGSIGGYVYVDGTTQTLAGATVDVIDPTSCVFGSCATVGTTTSAVDGSYLVSGLPVQQLQAVAYYTWGGPSYSAEPPVDVSVTESEITSLDLYMTPAASINGRVTRASDGAGLANVDIYTCLPNQSGVSDLIATTDAGGYYAATQLAAGDYIICVTGFSPYQDQFYSGHALSPPSQNNQAYDTISLATGQAVGNADFILTEGGHIRGVLTDRYTGLPIANQTIFFPVYDTAYTNYSWLSFAATTDASGHYEIAGLPDSSIYLGAYEDSPSYALSVYGCTPDPCNFSNATPLLASAGTALDNIDFSLFPDWVITGHVSRRSNGQPVVGATVRAFGDFFIGPAIVSSTVTDANGDYALLGVFFSSFVEVSDASASGAGLIDQDYHDHNCTYGWCARTSADLLPRVPYGVTPGINFQLDAGAALSGRITNQSDGSGVAAYVYFYSVELGYTTTGALSQADGSYTSPALTPGTYYVYAERNDDLFPAVRDCAIYAGVICDAYQTNITSGTPITVVGTQDQTGIDISLPTETVFSNGFE